ncbi:thioesterase family protein [Actinopolymorpha sp. B17G11]|uniref:acyl-CoA thioesterase n=1 Tax=unclassified Actinopolymorpha TaxID=2627063 RepID=UPI0032D8FB86
MAPFVFQCPLRWSDMDSYGHVNNVEFLRLLEEARVALFFDGARQAGVKSFEGELVVVRHEIDYKRPLVYRPEPITVETWVTTIRSSSFTIDYEVSDEATRYASARSVLAAYDAELDRPRRLSPEELSWLERYRGDE